MRNITKAIAIAAMLAFPVASFAQTAPAATKEDWETFLDFAKRYLAK